MIPADSGMHEIATNLSQQDMTQIPFSTVPGTQTITSIGAVLADVEGTMTTSSFFSGVLLPYIKSFFGEFLVVCEDVAGPLLTALEPVIAGASPIAGGVLHILLPLIESQSGPEPLKDLQDLFFQHGYKSGNLQAAVYKDACILLNGWHALGIPLYTFSSTSISTQVQMFSNTTFGDMSEIFDQYFDSKIGNEATSETYHAIATKTGFDPSVILFLSDTVAKLDAAKQAGMQTLLLCRDQMPPAGCQHPWVSTFNQIDLQ